MKRNSTLVEIIDLLQSAKRVLIVTHVYPDGDALGSQIALGKIMEALGKDVVLFGEEKVSHLYEFLPGSEKIITELPQDSRFDCAVALDCGDCYRLGKQMDRLLAITPLIVIDHHSGHKDFGTHRWVDAQKAATAEMIYELLCAMKAPLPFEAAYNLYAGIVADTGSFKYSSTSANTLKAASELVALGVNPDKVARNLFDNYSVSRLQLLKIVLETLELHADKRVAIIHVALEMYNRTGALPEDTETFINFPRALESVKVAVFLKETKDGTISVSLRSKGSSYDVAAIARKFNGGGHRNAAGFKKKGGEIDKVREMVLKALLPLFKE